jgi:hypothetical protein
MNLIRWSADRLLCALYVGGLNGMDTDAESKMCPDPSTCSDASCLHCAWCGEPLELTGRALEQRPIFRSNWIESGKHFIAHRDCAIPRVWALTDALHDLLAAIEADPDEKRRSDLAPLVQKARRAMHMYQFQHQPRQPLPEE